MRLKSIILLLSVFMKVINNLGNEYKGTLGKAVTAAKWKGRNYFKKHFTPANPKSTRQTVVRGAFSAAVAAWHGFIAVQKTAYNNYQKYRKLQISAFNAMIGAYINKVVVAGEAYVAPSEGTFKVRDSVTQNGIVGVLCVVRKTGQSTEYTHFYTGAGGTRDIGACAEDENYDVTCSYTGYTTQTQSNLTAANLVDLIVDLVEA